MHHGYRGNRHVGVRHHDNIHAVATSKGIGGAGQVRTSKLGDGVIAALVLLRNAAAGGGVAVIGCAGGLIGLAVIVFGIMTLFMLFRLRRALAENAKLARESWAS